MKNIRTALVGAGAAVLAFAGQLSAGSLSLLDVAGEVTLLDAQGTPHAVSKAVTVSAPIGLQLQTGNDASATIAFSNGSRLLLERNSHLIVNALDEKNSLLTLAAGTASVEVEAGLKGHTARVVTHTNSVTVYKGARAEIAALTIDSTEVVCAQGVVDLVDIASGDMTRVRSGERATVEVAYTGKLDITVTRALAAKVAASNHTFDGLAFNDELPEEFSDITAESGASVAAPAVAFPWFFFPIASPIR